jgi:type III pantothenate kinase
MFRSHLTLAIDVGNTRIKFGLFERADHDTTSATLPKSVAFIAVPAAESIDWQKIAALFDQTAASISSAIIAGPNPAALEMVVSSWPNRGWPQPRIVSRSAELPLRTNVEHPDQVGIDRLLNAVAANVLRSANRGVIIVSAGTATTIDLITSDGAFSGGAIMPGLELGARALHDYTALLPLIDVPALIQRDVTPLGEDTHAAISSGLWYGQIGAVREIVCRLAEPATQPTLILVTGGNGSRLAQALGNDYHFEPDLALRGLAFTAQFSDHDIPSTENGDAE